MKFICEIQISTIQMLLFVGLSLQIHFKRQIRLPADHI